MISAFNGGAKYNVIINNRFIFLLWGTRVCSSVFTRIGDQRFEILGENVFLADASDKP